MKHATAATLQSLQPLLEQLRVLPGLVERTPGTFYLRSKAFLHFHEDATGIFADVKLNGSTFERQRVSSAAERTALLIRVRRTLSPPAR